jgi:hypothetical protein
MSEAAQILAGTLRGKISRIAVDYLLALQTGKPPTYARKMRPVSAIRPPFRIN